MNFKALLKSNKKLIFKFCLLIGSFLIMTLFIFNNESFYKRTIIKITDISTSNAGVNTSPTGKTENTFTQNIKAKILNIDNWYKIYYYTGSLIIKIYLKIIYKIKEKIKILTIILKSITIQLVW